MIGMTATRARPGGETLAFIQRPIVVIRGIT
jgi:hypothetical protein